MFKANVLCDSVNPFGSRLTTVELTYPHCIHPQFLTHRMFSRNSASSRAIPVKKMLEQVENNPFIPIHWGKNERGMQAWEEVEDKQFCEQEWVALCNEAICTVRELAIVEGLHKQIANRLLEPWMWITVICTGNQTAYENFFSLRCHKDAEPHIQKIAYMLRDVYDASRPNQLQWRECHLPLTDRGLRDREYSQEELKKISTGRCARVSYQTHDGKTDPEADIKLHDRLKDNKHWSPFEHVATACHYASEKVQGNLGQGWYQYRKEFMYEVCKRAERD